MRDKKLMEENLTNQNDKPKKVPVLTIVAASFSGTMLILYLIFILAFFFHIGSYDEIVIIIAIMAFPVLSIATMVLAFKCLRDDIKPFCIPNLILSLFFVIASFPTSCCSLIAEVGISNQKAKDERQRNLNEEAHEIATIEYMKDDISTTFSDYYSREITSYFVSMEFTLLSKKPDSVKLIRNKEFYHINRGSQNKYGVYFFEDYSGVEVYCYLSNHQFIGGSVYADVTNYYSCDPEKGAYLYKLIRESEERANNNYPSSTLSGVVFYL